MRELIEDTRFTRAAEGSWRGALTDRWSIGAVPNGGYVLAAALRVLGEALPHPHPIVASAFYVRPTAPGDAEIAVDVVKLGKKFSTAEARIVQGGEERVRVVATFGELAPADEPALLSHGAPPELPPKDACTRTRPGVMPAIAARFEMAIDPPSIGFMEGHPSERAMIQGYVRFTDAAVPKPWALALIADAMPPPIFHRVKVGWVPTLELNVQFRARPTTDWLLCRFETRFAASGVLEEDGEVWDERGRLVALSRQTAILPLPR